MSKTSVVSTYWSEAGWMAEGKCPACGQVVQALDAPPPAQPAPIQCACGQQVQLVWPEHIKR